MQNPGTPIQTLYFKDSQHQNALDYILKHKQKTSPQIGKDQI